jgi:ABC-type multidrug transport system permease subunit
MAPGQTRSLVAMSNPLQRSFNTVLGIFLSSTLRILLVLLLLVSCYTSIAISIITSLPLGITITLVVLNAIIFFHHWYVMSR